MGVTQDCTFSILKRNGGGGCTTQSCRKCLSLVIGLKLSTKEMDCNPLKPPLDPPMQTSIYVVVMYVYTLVYIHSIYVNVNYNVKCIYICHCNEANTSMMI